jgi:predicted metalloprotease with PDZ domain
LTFGSRRRPDLVILATLVGWLCLALPAGAAESAPAASAAPIQLSVDAREAPRRLLHVRESVPAKPGPMTLAYPKFIPGEHGPTGPIADVAALVVSAGGTTIPWQRDPADMFSFRIDVPAGASSLDVAFDLLSPAPSVAGFSSGASATSELLLLSWNQVLLYPADAAIGELLFAARLRLPAGWKFGSALPVAGQAGGEITFATVSLETLVDSPVLSGAHFREVAIGPAGEPHHFLEIAADGDAALALSDENKAKYDRLVEEAAALFGSHPHRSYRFLLTLSDHTAHFGLEHHESSDDRVQERSLVDADLRTYMATLLPHEFVHSWNGKYRRPAELVRRNYQQPIGSNLLWVYEGLTEYLGWVLTGRSGLRSPEEMREDLAAIAEWSADERGRAWRPLEDTATAAQLLYEAREDWGSWRRGVDFYDEGLLIWLDADTLIRERSAGKRSLDDFCHAFHGGASAPAVKTYTLDDVVAALNAVEPYDWQTFFTDRVLRVADAAPYGGIGRAGWQLAFGDTRGPLQKIREDTQKATHAEASIGLEVHEDGLIGDVVPGKAADRAGVAPGMRLVAVDGRRFDADRQRDAIAATRGHGGMTLLVENGDAFSTLQLDYRDGARFPRLERIGPGPDRLSEILAPHAAGGRP